MKLNGAPRVTHGRVNRYGDIHRHAACRRCERYWVFVQTAILAYCVCCGEGCREKQEEWSDNSTNAMSMVTHLLRCSVECIGKPLYTDSQWKQALRQCEKLDVQVLTITDMQERLRLANWIETSIYKEMESQTNNAATLEFYYSALKTIDSLVNVLWTSTGDTNLVLGVWERFHRKARAIASSCEEERKKLEPEYKRLNSNSQYFTYKLTKVSKSELTPRERDLLKEVWEKRQPTGERYHYLDNLVNGYRRILVDEKGWNLNNRELAARFKVLSPEERDGLAAYTIEKFIAQSMR